MRLIAIDPGPEHSAYVVLTLNPTAWIDRAEIIENLKLLRILECADVGQHCVIEMITHMGMPAGASLFQTCVWIGQFKHAFGRDNVTLIPRNQVKLHVCGSMRAKDPNVRQAMLDRFGKPGTKKNPGPTYGITSHMWQALALAATWIDTHDAANCK